LNIAFSQEKFKITIGRFLPNWSKSKFFKPLDIFIPQTYFLNLLSFKGIDGFSFKYYFSALSSIEVLTVPFFDVRNIVPVKNISLTNEIQHTVSAFNLEFNFSSFENNLVFLKDISSDNNLIGFEFKGDLILGVWSELFYSFNGKKNKIFKTSFGSDYSIKQKYFFMTEFFYDESGGEKENYEFLRLNLKRMTLGKYYAMVNFNILSENDLNYGITYLENLKDRSFIIFPYLRSEVIQNFILGLSLYYFGGLGETEFSYKNFGKFLLNCYLTILF
jgi:hypothetical protein